MVSICAACSIVVLNQPNGITLPLGGFDDRVGIKVYPMVGCLRQIALALWIKYAEWRSGECTRRTTAQEELAAGIIK
jgi:hypothetical protein